MQRHANACEEREEGRNGKEGRRNPHARSKRERERERERERRGGCMHQRLKRPGETDAVWDVQTAEEKLNAGLVDKAELEYI